ncbi:MAG: hypothetical protein WC364_11975 [Eubacteriales bacterium]|jgi:hypothetical protein
MSWYRIKPKGRYVHKCMAGCGVFIKIKRVKCIGCVADILSNRERGAWREDLKAARRQERSKKDLILAETLAIYAGQGI